MCDSSFSDKESETSSLLSFCCPSTAPHMSSLQINKCVLNEPGPDPWKNPVNVRFMYPLFSLQMKGTKVIQLLCASNYDFMSTTKHTSLRRDGSVVRALASHQCGPGSIPGLGVIRGLGLLLVLVLAPRGFSPGTIIFHSPQKPTFPNSNSR